MVMSRDGGKEGQWVVGARGGGQGVRVNWIKVETCKSRDV